MSRIQRIVYAILKVIIRFFLHVFYPRQLVTGKQAFQLTRPTLVVSNHPNTLIDALVAAGVVSQPLFMLANAGLFKSPLSARLFSFLYCIPVERPQDIQGRAINNEASFARCYAHLQAGHHIFIAPEGGSEMERRIRPLRTGTARIALGAEASNDFNTGVQIVPIGLTYQEPDRGGSALAIQAGIPVRVKDWEVLYRQDASKAYRDLTDAIETQLRELVTDAPDKETDTVLAVLEGIQQSGKLEEPAVLFEESRRILSQLRVLQVVDPDSYRHLKGEALGYASRLRECRLSEQGLCQWAGHPVRWIFQASYWFIPWVAGWLLYSIPIAAVRFLLIKLRVDVGYNTTVKWVGAMFVLPVWLGLLGGVLSFFILGWAWWAAWGSMLVLGYVYAVRRPHQRLLAAQIEGYLFLQKQPQTWESLQIQRSDVWQLFQDSTGKFSS